MPFLNTDNLRTDEIFLRLDRTAAANPERGWVPAYHFTVCRASDAAELGFCDLRIGYTEGLYYGGHIGYTIYAPHRGYHYAAKACLLLFELARRHGMPYLYITCNPDNAASRRSCEYAGGSFVNVVDLPPDNDMYADGDRQKCVYRFDL
ncbi:MAG: GNAT family N-acetyltransferase [Clostridiales bacterium]|nr:GNAT family N-acetyltransferase [Clostridiales bacterium]